MEEQMKNKKNSKKRKRLKRKLASMTAMVLVLTVGMMGTMAYLSTVTTTKNNTFTGSKGISLQLTEPQWDAGGDDDANNYTPGKVIAKDPTLTNNTSATGDTSATEWVAIAVSYHIGDGAATPDYKPISYTAMNNLIDEIDFYDSTAASTAHTNNNSIPADEYWIPIYMTTNSGTGAISNVTLTDNSKSDDQAFAIYMYSKTLAKDASTPALFNEITVKGTTALEGISGGLAQLKTYVDTNYSGFISSPYNVNGNLPNFKIDVIGAAVQNEYDDKDHAGTLSTSISQLSDANKNQLIKDLVEVLEKNIDKDILKIGGTT